MKSIETITFHYNRNNDDFYLGPFGHTEFIDRQSGLLTPSSHVPHWMLTFSDNMSFYERWFNSLVASYDWIVRDFLFLPGQEKFLKNLFPELEPIPPMNELLQKVAVVLVNTHRALAPPRPSMPSKIAHLICC